MIKSIALGACLVFSSVASADITVIGGSVGNGDFNAGGGGTNGGAQTYAATPNWFNGQAAETVNFTNSSQMGGSTDPNNGTTTRGGMPFNNRLQLNDTSYTVVEAGQVFSLSYDFGAGGGPAGWQGLEVMDTFIFSSTTAVDGNTVAGDITILGTDNYAIDRANDGQWTTRTVTNLYTTTAADVGNDLYFGMQFNDNGTGNALFPRIDIINLEVTDPVGVPEPSSLGLLGLIGVVALARRKRR
jgi:hypothetical protein